MKTPLVILLGMVCTALQAQGSDSAQYYFQKAIEAKNEKKYLVASQLFTKSISFNGSNVSALLENAYMHKKMRKTDQAKAYFIKVLEVDPGHVQARAELMQLYFDYRQFAKAIELAEKCTSCDNALRISGISYYQLENYARAEKDLLAAIKINPDDAEANYTLARTYLDMEEYKKALPYYEKAIANPSPKSSWIYEKGLLHYTLNEYPLAMKTFLQAAEHGYVQSNDFKENLGYACIYSGKFEMGEELLLSIWEKKPGSKDILRDMAEIFYQQKQYDKSLQYCQKLLEMDDKDGKALYQAGLCFQKKGQKDRGMQMCDKAIEMDPSLASLRREKKMPGGL